MKIRVELFSIFQKFHSEVRTQFNTLIRILRSDNAKKYLSGPFFLFLFCPHMRFFINPLTLILLNRIEWLSVRTVIWLKPLALSSLFALAPSKEAWLESYILKVFQ